MNTKFIVAFGILFAVSIVRASEPATGPSGTVCESAGGSCKGIPDGTLIPHKLHCGKFIQCFLECGCDRECGGGLHFNKVKQVCDWPTAAGCDTSGSDPSIPSWPGCGSSGGSCKNISDGTLIPNPNDCTKYIQCSRGCEISSNCPAGTHFSKQLKQCTWPSKAACDSSPGSLIPSCPGPNCPPQPGCESSGGSCKNIPDGTFISFSNDCTKYIQCSKGCGIALNCPAGTHFSKELKQCTWPSKAGCDSSPGNLTPACPGPNCPQPPQPGCESSGGSCKNTPDGTFISFNNDCTKYIQCSKGCGIALNCPAGTHFSKELKQCTWPSKAGCDSSPGTPTPSCPGPNCPQPPKPSCESSGGSCKNTPDGTFIAFNNDCTKYIQCSKGCGIALNCPAGTHFSKELKQCTWPSKAGCDSSPGNLTPACPGPNCPQPPQPGCESSGGSCKNTPDGTFISFNNDCTKYIQCSKGCGIALNCPAGTQFSPVIKQCTVPSKAGCDPSYLVPSCPGPNCPQPPKPGCESSGGSCKNIPDGTFISFNNDCTKYIQCSKGCGIALNCPAGTHFCPVLQQCLEPSKAGCDPSYLIPSCPGPNCPQPPKPSCESSGGSCKNIPDGTFISFNNDCTKYIQCSKGCGITLNCPAGTHFCPVLQQCLEPSKAGCDPSYLIPSCPGPNCPQPQVPGCGSSGGSCKNIPDGTFISFNNDCTKYIHCSKGCGIALNCPAGTHFCPVLQQCLEPSKAGCDPSYLIPSCPGPNCPQPPKPGCQSSGGSCKNIPNGTFVSFANDSTKFIQCSNGCGIVKQCLPGTRFCQKLQQCTQTQTPCEPSKPSEPSITEPDQSICSGKQTGKLLPFPGDCSKFIACADGTAYVMDCGAQLHFNASFEICDWPEQAGCDPSYVKPENPSCQSKGAFCANEDDGKLLPYTGNCEWFVACANGCGFDKKCGKGLHFNRLTESCDWPADAGCDDQAKLNPGTKQCICPCS